MLPKTKLNASVYWLIHPPALALYVFLILYFTLPNYFKKYEVEVVSSQMGTYTHEHYVDLNNNGKEEIIQTAYNAGDVPKLLLLDYKGKTINQWNFKGKWLEDRLEIIEDYDHNDLKEIYCLTLIKDSISLSIIEPFNGNGVLVNNRFIDLAGVFNQNQVSVAFVDAKLIDTNGDGYKEYVFVLYAGFSKFPRKVYVYDIKNDSLMYSPESAAGISIHAYFQDINNDGIDEICGKVTAHENIHYPMPYTDSSSWVMVFNLKKKVDFLFPPIEQKTGIGSEIITYPYAYKDQSYFLSILSNRSVNNKYDNLDLKLFDIKGNLIREKTYNRSIYGHLTFFRPENQKGQWIYLYDAKGNIFKTDTSLNLIEHYLFEEQEQIASQIFRNYSIDLNGDSQKEHIIMVNQINLGVLIYSSEFKDPIHLDIPSLNGSADWKLMPRTPTLEDPSNLIINGTTRVVKLRYGKNPLFIWKYPSFIAVYLILFFIFYFLQKAQRFVVSKRYETEKQLLQQQMALSKKQMEPHFMLNMINNIGYMFSKEDKEDAMFYLGKFGSLMRQGLINSKASRITLEKELEFVEDYLILQKKLMDDELEYSLKLDDVIEEDKIQLPHSLIYTFVENAIKHGLKPKEKDRKLEVRVIEVKQQIKITIQDNGIGRQKSKELNTTDTGKGMEIIKTIIQGYNQLHGGNISYDVEDVLDKEGKVGGTLVEVWV